MSNSKNVVIVILLIILVGLIGTSAYLLGRQNARDKSVDKDAEQVLPLWTKDLIAKAFADKYKKNLKVITVNIEKESGDFVKGSVKFSDVEVNQGAMFFAKKIDGSWEIIWDGHGTYDCSLLDKYSFPADFKSGCLPDKTGTSNTKTDAVENPKDTNALNIAGIRFAFAEKYHKDINLVTVNITQQSGIYFRGNVRFSDAEVNQGGMFLAMRGSGIYEIIVDGHGTYDCAEVSRLGFPPSMIEDCSGN